LRGPKLRGHVGGKMLAHEANNILAVIGFARILFQQQPAWVG
jgi:hypothetical protein